MDRGNRGERSVITSHKNDDVIHSEEGGASSSPATGIPEFWLTAMKNTDIFSDWIKVGGERAWL